VARGRKRLDERALAGAGLACDEHDFAGATLGVAQAPGQLVELRLAFE